MGTTTPCRISRTHFQGYVIIHTYTHRQRVQSASQCHPPPPPKHTMHHKYSTDAVAACGDQSGYITTTWSDADNRVAVGVAAVSAPPGLTTLTHELLHSTSVANEVILE